MVAHDTMHDKYFCKFISQNMKKIKEDIEDGSTGKEGRWGRLTKSFHFKAEDCKFANATKAPVKIQNSTVFQTQWMYR